MNPYLLTILIAWSIVTIATLFLFAVSLKQNPRPIRGTKLWQTVLLMLVAAIAGPLFWGLVVWPASRVLVEKILFKKGIK